MSKERIIPVTSIWRCYQELRGMNQENRLAKAEGLVKHPAELAALFADSATHFASYDNRGEHFYPPSRFERDFDEEIRKTNDVVLRLRKQNKLTTTEAPSRRTEHGAGAAVAAVPASLLACDYVDRELLVQRTTSPARWEDGRPNIGGLRLDLLLADSADRTPIVGELKLPGDKDPFFALIQALACAAHLATNHQYERMRQRLPGGKIFHEIPTPPHYPRFDVWVLSYKASSQGAYMGKLQKATKCLAPRLLAQDAIRGSVRRIAGLDLKLEDSGTIAAEVLWAWERLGE